MTPTVPIRIEFTVELPGTPDQIWQAIATGPGMSAWSMPSEVDERLGGEFVQHMGEADVRGVVGGWEPPRRFVVEEPAWAELMGHAGADVTPFITEYLVEARSGGTCVLRVVSSAFGTGADWEREFVDEAERYWLPLFDNLRLYLTHFPGQQATTFEASGDVKGSVDGVLAAVRAELGADRSPLDLHGVAAEVETSSAAGILFRLVDPPCGYVRTTVFTKGDGVVTVSLIGYLFGPHADDVARSQQRSWSAWLNSIQAAVA
jgi:uncharacterized protein YndB with AHSA1/START domain